MLIYDVGMLDGADTRHYLAQGANVVAIDANPAMCEQALVRFRDEIAAGRLVVFNVGIASERGRQLEFWSATDEPAWSSFLPEIAGRDGARHHTVMIACMPISDVIGQHGVPDYMKVDIEGYDRACIAGLSADIAPPYISIEMGHPEGGTDIEILYDLGYRGFKIICQNNRWWQATLSNIGLYERHHRHPIGRATRKFGKMWVQLAGRAVGESGPWGEATDGRWFPVDHALSVWRRLRDAEARFNADGRGWWFDVHARKGGS